RHPASCESVRSPSSRVRRRIQGPAMTWRSAVVVLAAMALPGCETVSPDSAAELRGRINQVRQRDAEASARQRAAAWAVYEAGGPGAVTGSARQCRHEASRIAPAVCPAGQAECAAGASITIDQACEEIARLGAACGW